MVIRWLVVCCAMFMLGMWSAFAQEGTSEQAAQITPLAWSPQGDRLVAGFDDGTVRIWQVAPDDLELGTPAVTFTSELVDTLQWTPNGDLVTIGRTPWTFDSKRLVRVEAVRWNTVTGQSIETLYTYHHDTSLSFNPYGYYVAPTIAFNNAFTLAGLSENSSPPSVLLSNGSDVLFVDHGFVQRIVWSPNDARIAVAYGGWDESAIRTFDVSGDTINYIGIGLDFGVREMAWSADASTLAVSSGRCNATACYANVRTYRITSGNDYIDFQERIWSFEDEESSPTAIFAWHPVQKIIAVASAGQIEIFDVAIEEPLLNIPQAGVRWMDWSPDGTRIAAARADGTIRLYAVPPLVVSNP